VRTYIGPSRIGRVKVAEVRRADVQALADEVLADGLSPASVGGILNLIQTFLPAGDRP
jgi:hypothetical protein